MRYSKVFKNRKTESRRMVVRNWKEDGKRNYCLMGIEFQFYNMKSMKLVGGNSYTVLGMQPLNSTVRDGKFC